MENRNGIVRHYIVNVTEMETGLDFQSNSSMESLSLVNLHPAYTYLISVCAVTISRGPCSIAVNAVTREDGKVDIWCTVT